MPIVDINGRPISTEPERMATLADLKDLFARMGGVAERLAAHHPARTLLSEAAMWLSKMAEQVVATRQQGEQLAAALEEAMGEIAALKEHLAGTQEECNRLAQELESKELEVTT